LQGIQRWRIREPFCGVSHAVGAMLSVVALYVLLSSSSGRPLEMACFAVYGASMVILFTASALYHSLHGDPERVEKLRTYDQVAIYLLIAGTYTPVCLISLGGALGYGLLAMIWTVAVIGGTARVTWRAKPEWLTFCLYLVMGYACMLVISPLTAALKAGGLRWLMIGGVCYTVGAIVLATGRPRLWPGRFSYHDLWHVFVLGGSACHFIMMWNFVATVR
jgi:hemolysin III